MISCCISMYSNSIQASISTGQSFERSFRLVSLAKWIWISNIHNLTIEQSATPTSRRASSFAWHGLQDYNQSAPDPSSNPPASDLVECWLSQSCKLPHLPPNATLSVQLTNACGSLKAASSLKLYKEWHTETRQVVMAMASTFHPMKNTNLPHGDLRFRDMFATRKRCKQKSFIQFPTKKTGKIMETGSTQPQAP